MSNQLNSMVHKFMAVLTDCNPVHIVPNAVLSDTKRLINLAVRDNGKEFFLVDLPKFGKLFDKALSGVEIKYSDIPRSLTTQYMTRDGRQSVYSNMFEQYFDSYGYIHHALDYEHVYFVRQMSFLYKKAVFDCPTDKKILEIEKWLELEKELRLPSGNWTDTSLFGSVGRTGLNFSSETELLQDHPRADKLLRILDKVCKTILSQYPSIDDLDIIPKHGPGTVADIRGMKNKYCFPSWPFKLGLRFPFGSFGSNEMNTISEKWFPPTSTYVPALLLAVPKTYSKPRLITSEPTANQFVQHGLLGWLRTYLPSVVANSVDFNSQDPSKEIALSASSTDQRVNQGMGTVDLSAASDRLTCWTVERIFGSRTDILEALSACRTHTVSDGTGLKPFHIQLRKYAGQGSATTFPIQSITYFMLAVASIIFDSGCESVTRNTIARAGRKVRVFGDDIIMPSSSVPILNILLKMNQLKMNIGKTHIQGSFRESCGMDAYKGHSVTPVYIRDVQFREHPTSLPSWIDVRNNAYSAGLWRLADLMMNEARKYAANIPTSNTSQGCVCALTHQNVTFCKGKTVFDSFLHYKKWKCYVPISRPERAAHNVASIALYQWFLESPEQTINWSSGYDTANRSKVILRWVPLV